MAPGGPRRAVLNVVHVVQFGWVQFAAGQPGEQVHADRPHQRLGERVVDQRFVGAGGHGAGRRDHGRGHPDAGCQVPGVSLVAEVVEVMRTPYQTVVRLIT